jgi:hypothetical protein
MMKKSSVFHVNFMLLVVFVTVLLISMPVFCFEDLHSESDSALMSADEFDTMPISDLGRQIDILAFKLESLENSLKGVMESVTKTNEYIKIELVEAESKDPGIIKNVVSMIASERQEVENTLKQQRELKGLLKYYGSILKEKTALLEKNANSSTKSAEAIIPEIKTDGALSKSDPEPQKAKKAVVTTGNSPLIQKNADSPAKPAARITEIKTGGALSKSDSEPQKDETAGVTPENKLLQKDKRDGSTTVTNLAIGLILIFVVVLLIVTLTMFQKISGQMNDSDGLQVDAAVPLPTAGESKSGSNGNVDHSLPIVVSEAVFRIRMTMNGVDRSNEQYSAFGYQLSRVEDAITRHGYSIIDLTGKPYENDQSMKVVNIVERDDIDPGTTIVNRTLKPQIMFDKTIISHGTVELATSSKAESLNE